VISGGRSRRWPKPFGVRMVWSGSSSTRCRSSAVGGSLTRAPLAEGPITRSSYVKARTNAPSGIRSHTHIRTSVRPAPRFDDPPAHGAVAAVGVVEAWPCARAWSSSPV
jgi:hypothetical protein